MQFLWFKNKQPSRQPRLMDGQDEYVFRRSRTITGSVSPQITASAQSRGQLKTDRLKLMELRSYRQQVLKMLGAVLLAAGALAFLAGNLTIIPAISAAQPGVRQHNIQAYQQTVSEYFGAHPLERFGFAMRPDAIQDALRRAHNELAGIGLQRDWYGGNVQLTLYFRQPLLMWQTDGERFYVDKDGVAYGYNHFAEPAVAVTDESGLPPDHTGLVASARFIRFLGLLVDAVNGYDKGKVKSIIIPSAAREIDLKLEGRDFLVRTHIDRDPHEQAQDIAFALNYFDQRGIRPQYIDMRVAHKAFYRD